MNPAARPASASTASGVRAGSRRRRSTARARWPSSGTPDPTAQVEQQAEPHAGRAGPAVGHAVEHVGEQRPERPLDHQVGERAGGDAAEHDARRPPAPRSTSVAPEHGREHARRRARRRSPRTAAAAAPGATARAARANRSASVGGRPSSAQRDRPGEGPAAPTGSAGIDQHAPAARAGSTSCSHSGISGARASPEAEPHEREARPAAPATLANSSRRRTLRVTADRGLLERGAPGAGHAAAAQGPPHDRHVRAASGQARRRRPGRRATAPGRPGSWLAGTSVAAPPPGPARRAWPRPPP